MRSVKQHYDELLGPVYSWILGDFEKARAANLALFEDLGIAPTFNAIAVDLGSGPGCQSIPLAKLGYAVTAVDFCGGLLDEMRERADGLSITAVCDDLLNFRHHVSDPELIVCMGDTLVHLPDIQSVDSLIDSIAAALLPGGRFIATLRDYSTAPLTDGDRFIPIRNTDEQIFTCFLEYLDGVINVHDILQEKIDGEWNLKVSNYQKLLLDFRYVQERLGSRGLTVTEPTSFAGMVVLQAAKTAEAPVVKSR